MHRLLAGALAVALPSVAAAAPCDEAALTAPADSDLPRHVLDVEACLAAEPGHREAVRARRAAIERLRAGDFAEVTVGTDPEGGSVTIAALDRAVADGTTVWLPLGTHRFRAALPGHRSGEREVVLDAPLRATVVVTLEPEGRAATTDLDFGAESEPSFTARDPDGPEHDNLVPARFGSGPADGGPAAAPRRSRWPFWLGAAGLIAVGAGVAAGLEDRSELATALFVGGGAATAAALTGLVFKW
jgi:hypothetical protein